MGSDEAGTWEGREILRGTSHKRLVGNRLEAAGHIANMRTCFLSIIDT